MTVPPTVNKRQRTDYTEGSIVASILKMGLPSMFGFLMQHTYSLVDTWWVSRLSDSEASVAAITFFASIHWLFFTFNNLIGPGSVALISRRYGEKSYDLVEKLTKETIVMKLALGGVFGLIGYIFAEPMLTFVGAEGVTLDLGVQYGRIMFIGMGIMYATYSIYTAMRGVANPHQAMALMLGANVLNMGLDPIFMFGYLGFPAMGIRGAAWASVLSFTIVFLVGILLFYSGRTNVRLHLRGKERMTWESIWKITYIGIPAWIGDMSFAGARLVLVRLVAPFGTPVVAAYGVGNQVTSIGVAMLVGIGLGLSALIGHNIGGAKMKRAKETADKAILLGVGLKTGMATVVFLFAPEIMRMFFESPETVHVGSTMLRIFALGFPFIGAFMMIAQVHTGVGLNGPTMVVNLINAWVLEVAPVYLLTVYFGFSELSVWWSISLAGALSALLFYWYYQRGKWLAVSL
ncbi:MAG: MATE family efflux transporter [Candidatus Zixiibacteriota bacterium]